MKLLENATYTKKGYTHAAFLRLLKLYFAIITDRSHHLLAV